MQQPVTVSVPFCVLSFPDLQQHERDVVSEGSVAAVYFLNCLWLRQRMFSPGHGKCLVCLGKLLENVTAKERFVEPRLHWKLRPAGLSRVAGEDKPSLPLLPGLQGRDFPPAQQALPGCWNSISSQELSKAKGSGKSFRPVVWKRYKSLPAAEILPFVGSSLRQ